MARPPTSGVLAERHRLAWGARSRCRETRERSRIQREAAAAGAATTAATMFTGSEGRRRVLGLCLPAQAVPRLLRADDGLRRPAAVSRAVRQPVSPRFPGEIQGIAARRVLVAPEPARAARGLPRRLRRADQERVDS